MTTESRLIAFVEQAGADHKALKLEIGDLTALKTQTKEDLVKALNELFDRPSGGGGPEIDDTDYETPEEYSATKVISAFKAMGHIITLFQNYNTLGADVIEVQNDLRNVIFDSSWDAGINFPDRTISSEKLKTVFDAMTQSVTDKVAALRTELTAGANAALDTFKELADALNNDPNFAATLATQMSKRLRFDSAQSLTTAEKLQACANLGIGNPEVDLLAAYNAAKA